MATRPEPRAWYTSGEVAEMFGVTDRTIANWADAGVLPHHTTPGGHRRFPAAAIRELLEQRTTTARSTATHD